MKTISSLFLSLCLLTSASYAADIDGNYAVWGVGKSSCYKYLESRQAQKDSTYIDYTKGFITAYNMLMDDTYSLSGKMTIAEIMNWMDNFCDTKQTTGYENALLVFVSEHETKRMKKARKAMGR